MNRTMKKFFEKTIKLLFDLALITIMLVSAQQVMNLPIGWKCIMCIVIFGAALTVYTYREGKEYYKEGVKTGIKICQTTDEIYDYADDGEDEFTITAENEVIFSPYILFLTLNTILSPKNKYKYKRTSMINNGKETEVTFTKIKD